MIRSRVSEKRQLAVVVVAEVVMVNKTMKLWNGLLVVGRYDRPAEVCSSKVLPFWQRPHPTYS